MPTKPAQTTTATTTTLRIATLNTWGLPPPFSWPPRHVRFPRISRWLKDGDFDVVALQELWWPLPAAFSALFPHPVHHHEGRSGLALVASPRVTVSSTDAAPFRTHAGRWVERLWLKKGWLRSTIEVAGVAIDVINTHLQAWVSAGEARVRRGQIGELLDVAARAPRAVLLGDFNVYQGDRDDAASLSAIHAAGFVDALAPHDERPTFDDDDKRGARRADQAKERERFDRVFVRGLEAVAGRVVVGGPFLSDHRPVEVTLRVR